VRERKREKKEMMMMDGWMDGWYIIGIFFSRKNTNHRSFVFFFFFLFLFLLLY